MRSLTVSLEPGFSQLMISSISSLVKASLLKYSTNSLTVLSLCCWASGNWPLPSLLGLRVRRPLNWRRHRASQLYGPFPAENKHHPWLSGRPARRKRVLASRGNSFLGFGEKEFWMFSDNKPLNPVGCKWQKHNSRSLRQHRRMCRLG